jgi:hypothetical protein
MASFTLKQWNKALPAGLKKKREAAIRGLRSVALRAKGIVIEEIDAAEPYPAVDTGGMRQSVQVVLLPDGGEVVVDAPHAPIMENGARPFWPPLAPLIAWVERKGLVSRPKKLDTRRGKQLQRLANKQANVDRAKAYEKEVENVARLIQAKIAAHGIEPRHYFAKAMARVSPMVPKAILDEMEKVSI